MIRWLALYCSFRCGRPPVAASTAHRPTPLAGVDQHPLFRGAREFCSAAIARNAARRQGKISGERRRRKATRAKASGSRQERLQWGKAVSPNGTHAKNVRFESATVAGRNLRREQGLGVARDFRRKTQSGGCAFRQAVKRGRSVGEGGACGTVHRTGGERLCNRSWNARFVCAVIRGWPRDERRGAAGAWLPNVLQCCNVGVLQCRSCPATITLSGWRAGGGRT